MRIATARNRQGRKVDQVIDGARLVFMQQGYARASMDEIARVAGVSKATLYSYFEDKRALFTEMYRTEILRVADGAMDVLLPDADPEVALSAAAERILAYLTSDFGLAMYRICVSESARFPEIGAAFYESGPEMGRLRLGSYLQAAVARGVLVIPDIDLAADQFFQLCQTTLCDRMICGVQHRFTEAEIARTLKGAVAVFLAAYRPRP